MLHQGDIIERVDGQVCEVVMVNDCRALVAVLDRRERSFFDGRRGRTVKFREARQHFSISPNAEVTVLKRRAS